MIRPTECDDRQSADCRLEPGSFRDRHGRVYYRAGEVYRAISAPALREWEALSTTRFFRRLMVEGKIIGTRRAEGESTPAFGDAQRWAAVLSHDAIPFVSYPYEWSFDMLRDAALLQLEVLQAAVEEDMILKDATPFNIQWMGSRPAFIDIPSFTQMTPGQVWVGYRQFCQLFLYPLMFQAYKDVDFHDWVRGSIDGIDPEQCNRLMSVRDLLRRGVLTHVYLQAVLQRRLGNGSHSLRNDLQSAGFSKAMIEANLRGMTKLVRRLKWKRGNSEWSDYAENNSYDDADRQAKEAFVREAADTRRGQLIWDLGCNTGTFSRIAAESGNYVIAMDSDHLAVNRLYRSLRAEDNRSILPLVMNVANSSPGLGWRQSERKTLCQRGRPDLTLCLALIHHVVISANIPVLEFVDWLADLGCDLVIEFVTKDDAMVKKLLRNKDDQYEDYEIPFFETCLASRFDVRRRVVSASGSRILYFAVHRG